MAETRIFMPLCAAPQRVFLNPVVLGLRPLDDTGIQQRRVRDLNESNHGRESSVPKDLGTLDSCDKHRNEGETGASTAAFA
jgi:hypothetical protein